MAEFNEHVLLISAKVIRLGFVFSLLIGLPILFVRRSRWEQSADAYLPLFRGLRMTEQPEPGLVRVEFTVYQGFLLWFTQTTFKLYGPPEDTKEFLARCLSFSLRRGLLASAGLLMPFVLFPTYWFQQRAIRQQIADLTEAELQMWPRHPEIEPEDSPHEVSKGLLPWIAVVAYGLLTVMLVSTVAYAASAGALNEMSDVGEYAVFGGISCLIWGLMAQLFSTR